MKLIVLMIFHDDSSLFVARRVASSLTDKMVVVDFLFIESGGRKYDKISQSQIEEGFPKVDITYRRSMHRSFDERILKKYDAVISAKFPVFFRQRAISKAWIYKSRRPCFVAMFPGIEFFPERGFEARGMFDIIAFNNIADLELYNKSIPEVAPLHQQKIVFNPVFTLRDTASRNQSKTDIVFFTQSVTPASRQGRQDILMMLAKLARDNARFRVVVKLRHLKKENQNHTHVEKHSYQDISQELGLCSLLHFTTGPVDTCLATCAYALTCSSTAGIEAIAQNIPTAFLTGFSDHQNDEIAVKASAKFGSSGLLLDLSDAHFLNFSSGVGEWRVRNLTNVIATDSLIFAIENFKSHPPRDVGTISMVRGSLQTLKEHWLFLKKSTDSVK